MKILIIGGGGREHSLLWALSRSHRRPKLFVAPGRAGMSSLATVVPITPLSIDSLVSFAETEKIDVTLCGPSAPLYGGLADAFTRAGLVLIGPSSLGALLGGSRCFAKAVMARLGIPTPASKVFWEPQDAKEYVRKASHPLVIKTDRRSDRNTVFLPSGPEEALQVVDGLVEMGLFDRAGRSILIEDRVVGPEVTILCLSDGHTVLPAATATEYRVSDSGSTESPPRSKALRPSGALACETLRLGSKVGAISPSPHVDETAKTAIVEKILNPVLSGLRSQGIVYRGFLGARVVLASSGPSVLGLHVTLGDPLAQTLLPRLKTDMVEVLTALGDERLGEITLNWDRRAAACLVLTRSSRSDGPTRTVDISGLHEIEEADLWVCQEETGVAQGRTLACGERVLSVTALGHPLTQARKRVYEGVSGIRFDGMGCLADLGAEVVPTRS